MADKGPVSVADNGVTVAVRVTPKARRQQVDGVTADAQGRLAVKIAVTAPPEDGKANKAIIALLSRTWNIPRNTISIQRGQTSRDKILSITGDTAALQRKIEKTMRTPHHA